MGVLSDDDLTVMRRRARHRLIGALALVVVLVLGVPQLIDHQGAPRGGAKSGRPSAPAASQALPTVETGPPQASSAAAVPPGSSAGPAASAADSPLTSGAGKSGIAGSAGAASEAGTSAGDASSANSAGGTPAERSTAAVSGHDATPAAELAAATAGAAGASARRTETNQAASTPDTVPPIDPQASAAHARAHGGKRIAAALPVERAAARHVPEHASEHASEHAAEAAPDTAAATHGRGWFVQIGVFSEAARAVGVSEQLEAKGVHVHREVIHGPKGAFTRVRAGPFGNRSSADEVLARVKSLGENAILVHQ